MTVPRTKRFIALVVGAMLALSSAAQEPAEQEAPPAPPDLANLQSGWWSYFENLDDEQRAERVATFFGDIDSAIANLGTSDQELALSIVAAIRDNLEAYRALLNEPSEEPKQLPPPEENYTVARLLEVAAEARDAEREADEYRVEVEREQRIQQGVRERRDQAFKRYQATAVGDDKLLAALRLVQDRTTLAITTRRLALLTERSRKAAAYAAAAAERVVVAGDRLPQTVSDEDVAELRQKVENAQLAISQSGERLQLAEVAASRLALDTTEGRSQQRLDRQRLIEAQVVHALTRLRWMNANTLHIWAELLVGETPDTAELRQLSLGATEYVREVRQEMPEWRTESADELLAVQTSNRDGLTRSARRLLDQRAGTAQITLTRIDELQVTADELQLLIGIAENAYVDNVGRWHSWLAISGRFFVGAWNRIGTMADTTLFTIGETPVAGSDIIRAIVILIIAFILSRLVQHAIGRISRSDSAGTQASLYTVGRLTHYAIITIAIIVALSWIGLDFSNLAIVAGALGVGIGFGLQSIVGNFVSGLIILFEHSLRVGDYIELDNGLTGTVKAINVRSTLITTNDNIDIVVPNSEFVNFRLTNWTLGERIRRVRVPFSVAYGTDKELVKKAALEAADEVPFTLSHLRGREIQVRLVEFGDSSLNFLMLVWVNRQGARRPGRTIGAYLWALEGKLREYGIEVPFPQRDLHLRSDMRDVDDDPTIIEPPEEAKPA